MAITSFQDFYEVPNLNFDISRLRTDLEKILLCDVQNKIYPNLEKTFLNLIHNSGYPGIRLEKKIDFTQLYKQRSN